MRTIEALIEILSKGKDTYIIITASDEDISDDHHKWFKLLGFSEIKLQPLSPKQIADFIDSASKVLNVEIESDTRNILINQSMGYPEYVLIAMRRILAEGRNRIDQDIGLQATYQSLIDAWLSTKRYIEDRNPATRYVIRALGFFRVALVTPYPDMVIAFAASLWKKERKSRVTLLTGRQLMDALRFLEKFDFGVKAGVILFPYIALDEVTLEGARDAVGEFLVNYRSWSQRKGLRFFHRSANEHSQCLLDLAYIAQSQRELDKAIKFYTVSLCFTSFPIIYVNRGSAFGESGQTSSALEDFATAEKLLGNDPLLAPVFYNRSIAYIESGNFESALQDINNGISLAPSYLSLYRNRGTVYGLQGKYEEALRDFDLVLNGTSIRFERAFTHYARGNTYKAMGDKEKALKDYSLAIQVMPDNPRKSICYRMRGNLYKELGDDQLALQDYTKAISLDPSDAYVLISRGHIYFDQKRYREALIDFNQATLLEPTLAIAYLGKSQVLAELCDFLGAEQEINKALSMSDTQEFKAMALSTRGKLYELKGQYKKALKDYGSAIEILPDYAYAYLKRAKIHERLGEFEDVISNCTVGLEHEFNRDNQLSLLLTRGSAYDELGEFNLALEDFNHALSIDAKNAYTHMNIGITLSNQEMLEKSLASISRAITYNPQLWEAYANRGRVYSELGKHKMALKDQVVSLTSVFSTWRLTTIRITP